MQPDIATEAAVCMQLAVDHRGDHIMVNLDGKALLDVTDSTFP